MLYRHSENSELIQFPRIGMAHWNHCCEFRDVGVHFIPPAFLNLAMILPVEKIIINPASGGLTPQILKIRLKFVIVSSFQGLPQLTCFKQLYWSVYL